MLKIAALLLTPLSFFCQVSEASAEWNTSVEDDLFSGKKATMIGHSGPFRAIYVTCTSEGDFTFSFIERGEWDDGLSTVPVELVLKVDDNERRTFKSGFYQHNTEYYGIQAEEVEDKSGLMAELVGAKRQIQIGMQVQLFDQQWSGTVSVSGSTRAGNRLIEACGIQQLG